MRSTSGCTPRPARQTAERSYLAAAAAAGKIGCGYNRVRGAIRPSTTPGTTSSPPDIEDNGVLSIGVKLMAVPGAKLLADERLTQDFTGLTVPTFQSADVRQNLELQRSVGAATPVFYFLRHPAIALMQGIYARTHANPLEARYWSCVPFLLGDGQAMQYTLIPRGQAGSRVPWHPPENYLRQAMVATLGEREAVFDFAVQLQTDTYRMPIENAAVSWPERLSRFVPVATLRLPGSACQGLK